MLTYLALVVQGMLTMKLMKTHFQQGMHPQVDTAHDAHALVFGFVLIDA